MDPRIAAGPDPPNWARHDQPGGELVKIRGAEFVEEERGSIYIALTFDGSKPEKRRSGFTIAVHRFLKHSLHRISN